MKSIDKLREYVDRQQDEYNNHNVSFVWQLSTIADEIEAEIAANYLELPKDADGVPIHVGDAITLPNGSRDDVRFITIRKYDTVFNERGWVPSQCTHAKPRTLEDLLVVMLEAAVGYNDAHTDVSLVAVEKYADEIRELLGGDAE